jgi:putative methionine-R-sulfoxide reductase with GAF domain
MPDVTEGCDVKDNSGRPLGGEFRDARFAVDVLVALGRGLGLRATLYSVEGGTLGDVVVPASSPACGLQSVALVQLLGASQVLAIRRSAISDCCQRRASGTAEYCSAPRIAEFLVPVLTDGTVMAMLGSGPFLVEEPSRLSVQGTPESIQTLERVPPPLLPARMCLAEQLARCLELAIQSGSRRKWEAILGALERLITAKDSREAMGAIVDCVVPAFHAHGGSVMLYHAWPDPELVLSVHSGPAVVDRGFRLAQGEGLCWKAMREGRTVRVNDVSLAAEYRQCYTNTRSEMVTPVRLGQRMLGVVNIESDALGAFDPADEVVIESFASIAALSLARREVERDVHLFRVVTEALASTASLEDTLRTALASISSFMHSRLCTLLLRERGEERVHLRALYLRHEGEKEGDLWMPPGHPSIPIWNLSYVPGEGFTGSVIKSGKPAIISRPQVGQGAWLNKGRAMWRALAGEEKITAVAAAPMMDQGDAIGAMVLTNRTLGARTPYFSEHDLHTLATLAGLITPAVIRARTIAKYEHLLESHEMGLCLVKKPPEWDSRWKGQDLDQVTGTVPMVLTYVNPYMRKEFGEFNERHSLCYEYFNKVWCFTKPCPWCPVVEVFNGRKYVEGATHSPAGPNNFVRHFKSIARRYVDPLTAEECAIESTTDITDSVELQIAFARLAAPGLSEARAVLQIIAEALGLTFQATLGWVFSWEGAGWVFGVHFTYVGDEVAKRELQLLKGLRSMAEAGPSASMLTAYIEQRARSASAYRFDETKASMLDATAFDGLIGEVRFPNGTSLPKPIHDALGLGKPVRLMSFPIPFGTPTAIVFFAEGDGSLYFPSESDLPELEVARSRATVLCRRMERIGAMALDRVRQTEAMRKAEALVSELGSAMANPGVSLSEWFKDFIPGLLGAGGFSLFLVDQHDGKLHLASSTGVVGQDGKRHVPDEHERRATVYDVSPDCGLTGWVAYYRWPLNVAGDQFAPEALAAMFDADIKGHLEQELARRASAGSTVPAALVPPRWMGKYNDNPPGEHCYLGMPLVSADDTLLGVCRVSGKAAGAGGEFGSEDERIFGICCRILALAMQTRYRTQAEAWQKFLLAISHPLSDPVGMIQGVLRKVKREGEAQYAQKAWGYFRELEVLTGELAAVVMRMRNYRTGISDALKVEPQPEDRDLVRELDSYAQKWLLKHHDSTCTVPANATSRFSTDYTVLREVIVELLENSWKHRGDAAVGANIMIDCEVSLADGGGQSGISGVRTAVIRVRDRGPGIPHDLKERIFEPFYTSDLHKGAGTGLTLARLKVQALQGTIVESGFPMAGACFEIRLVELRKGD